MAIIPTTHRLYRPRAGARDQHHRRRTRRRRAAGDADNVVAVTVAARMAYIAYSAVIACAFLTLPLKKPSTVRCTALSMCSGGELQEELKRAAAQSLGASIEESMKPADLEWAQRGSATMVEALRAAKERLATRKAQVGEAAALAELDASIRGQSPPPPPPLLTRRPKLWLVDRDGCINEDVGAPGVLRADELSLIPGSAGAVRRLRLAGRVAIVTNQSARGKGLLSAAELDAIHEALRHQLATTARGGRVGREQWDALYVCEDAGPSGRKKPSAGMVVQALDDFGCAPSEAVMIGDSWSDVVAARRAGCVGVLLATCVALRQLACILAAPRDGYLWEVACENLPIFCGVLILELSEARAALSWLRSGGKLPRDDGRLNIGHHRMAVTWLSTPPRTCGHMAVTWRSGMAVRDGGSFGGHGCRPWAATVHVHVMCMCIRMCTRVVTDGRTLKRSASLKASGSMPPAIPRYSFSAVDSLDSLTTAELITWSVVTYLRPHGWDGMGWDGIT